MWPFEREAIEAAVQHSIAGVPIRVVSLEYLLFLKLTSNRLKDAEDAERQHRRGIGSARGSTSLSPLARCVLRQSAVSSLVPQRRNRISRANCFVPLFVMA
jgi:hypothetical protein